MARIINTPLDDTNVTVEYQEGGSIIKKTVPAKNIGEGGGSGGDEIFTANYGITTWAQLSAAREEGKLLRCSYTTDDIILQHVYDRPGEIRFTGRYGSYYYELSCSEESGWFFTKTPTGQGTTYTAGENISISNNVISATDTTYTAGQGINISSSNVISATGSGGDSELQVISTDLSTVTSRSSAAQSLWDLIKYDIATEHKVPMIKDTGVDSMHLGGDYYMLSSTRWTGSAAGDIADATFTCTAPAASSHIKVFYIDKYLDVSKYNKPVVSIPDIDPKEDVGKVLTVNMDGEKEWMTGGGGGGAVDSVNGKTGVVVLDAEDIDYDEEDTIAEAIASNADYIAAVADDVVGLTTAVNGLSSSKQDVLTAGSNITITNNVIAATSTKYTAGQGINISSNNVISATGSSGDNFFTYDGTNGQAFWNWCENSADRYPGKVRVATTSGDWAYYKEYAFSEREENGNVFEYHFYRIGRDGHRWILSVDKYASVSETDRDA